MSAEQPIMTLTWDCDEYFQTFLTKSEEPHTKTHGTIADYGRRFSAWWEDLGVFANHPTNLDCRLQCKVSVRNIVVRLLLALQQNLEYRKYTSELSLWDADRISGR